MKISSTNPHAASGDDDDVLFYQRCFRLSGFTFPVRNMPMPVQYLTLLNPTPFHKRLE